MSLGRKNDFWCAGRSPMARVRVRDHRKAMGQCVRCGSPASPGHTCCEAHLQAMRNWYAQRPWEPSTWLAHCGTWQEVKALPWTCRICGWTIRQENIS